MKPPLPTPDSRLPASKLHRAVFMDRDGTICEEVGYLDSIERFRLIPRSGAAIRLLNHRGFKAVVVTNQSGVARGYFSEVRLQELHAELSRQLREEGAFLDGIYYCPHHPTEGQEPYRKICDCRKPAAGLLMKAAEDLDLDLTLSYAVGDRLADLECGYRAGAKGVLVLTGYGKEELASQKEKWETQPSFIAGDLYEAVRWITGNREKG
jgi:D-glycero-D-manno-heptose 1,7-bisphosphate phosphatase